MNAVTLSPGWRTQVLEAESAHYNRRLRLVVFLHQHSNLIERLVRHRGGGYECIGELVDRRTTGADEDRKLLGFVHYAIHGEVMR